jgi:hypothetical protein
MFEIHPTGFDWQDPGGHPKKYISPFNYDIHTEPVTLTRAATARDRLCFGRYEIP